MSSISDIFGFHNQYITEHYCLDREEERSKYLWHNVTHVLGYFPLVGIIIGIMRIAASRKEMEKGLSSHDQGGQAILQLRGWAEIVGIGSVFLPADVIVTVVRAINAWNRQTNDAIF
jgi:hypothetical protein